jgi:hypothetical protein
MSAVIKAESYAELKSVLAMGRRFADELAAADESEGMIVTAMALNEMRPAMTPGVMAVVRSMENTPLGFRTDKPDGYPDHILKDCVIQAGLDKLSLAGNQFNVIAGQYYITKEGWDALLRKLGATGAVPYASLPDAEDITEAQAGNSKKYAARMGGFAVCQFDGQTRRVELKKSDGFDTRRLVSAYGRDLAEAMNGIVGKTEATLLKKLYYSLCGKPEPVEAGEPIAIDVEPEAPPLITAKAAERATDEQVELYRKAVQGIEEAANITMLSVADQAIAALKKSGSLTADQLSSLRSLRDIRKQALK